MGCAYSASFLEGSLAHTSRPAARTLPELSPSSRAFSSRLAPRLVLMMQTPSFILAMVSALMMAPPSTAGAWTLIKSLSASSVSISTYWMPNCSSMPGMWKISKATTFMPIALAMMPRCWPMRPKPMMPSVRPCSSMPLAYAFFSHLPSRMEWPATERKRAQANIWPIASSATDWELARGVLRTSMPFSLA